MSSSDDNECTCGEVKCNLIAGFTTGYDAASNKAYERQLHAECRSYLYIAPAPGSGNPDSANRLREAQRGKLAERAAGETLPTAVESPLRLPESTQQRKWQLDDAGNWKSVTSTNRGPAASGWP